MFRDLKSRHHIEADQIIGDLIARATASEVPTPLLLAVFVRLNVYENSLTKLPHA